MRIYLFIFLLLFFFLFFRTPASCCWMRLQGSFSFFFVLFVLSSCSFSLLSLFHYITSSPRSLFHSRSCYRFFLKLLYTCSCSFSCSTSCTFLLLCLCSCGRVLVSVRVGFSLCSRCFSSLSQCKRNPVLRTPIICA